MFADQSVVLRLERLEDFEAYTSQFQDEQRDAILE